MNRKQLEQVVAEVGGEVEFFPSTGETPPRIEAWAPKGMQWAESNSVLMVVYWFPEFGDKVTDGINEMNKMIGYGLETFNE